MLDSRFVIISPSNTSPDLSDRTRFPNFLRLASGQHTQIVAIFALLHDLGQRYIQVFWGINFLFLVHVLLLMCCLFVFWLPVFFERYV